MSEERLNKLEADFKTLGDTVVENSEINDELIKEVDELKTNFKAFYLAVLQSSSKQLADTIFKTYQKLKFKK